MFQTTCPLKVHTRFTPKIYVYMYTPRKDLYQSCYKNYEISNLIFFWHFFFLFLGGVGWAFNMSVNCGL